MNYKYKSYFNTTPVGQEILNQCKAGSLKQEEAIEMFYKATEKQLTPSDILYLYPNNVPITSIRRAITQLTKKGILTMCESTKESEWGRPEHFWIHSNFKSQHSIYLKE